MLNPMPSHLFPLEDPIRKALQDPKNRDLLIKLVQESKALPQEQIDKIVVEVEASEPPKPVEEPSPLE